MTRARLLVLTLLLAHAPAAHAANPHVQFTTTLGPFIVELCAETSTHCSSTAPLTVAHFLRLVDQQYYPATTLIDRREPAPVSFFQGGAFYSGTDTEDFVEFIPVTWILPFETGTTLSNLRGSIGLLHEASLAGSAGWWYVNLTDNQSVDGNAVVFGQVVSGMSVLDAIGAVPIYPEYLLGNLPLIDYPGEPASVVPYLVHVTSTVRVPEPAAIALGGAALTVLAVLAARTYPARP